MTGVRHQRIQHQRLRPKARKETKLTTSPATTVSSGNLIGRYKSCHSISSGYGYRIHPVQESENCMLELIFHVQLEQRS